MKKLLAFLLLPFLLISGEPPHIPPINDLWFTYHIEPSNYWPVPNSAPHYTTAWYEEIILPYLDPLVGNLRGIEFYIVHNTIHQIRFENVSPNLSGWPTTWGRVNHQVKFYMGEGPFIGRRMGVNSFSEGGGAYTIWSPFDGTIDGKGPSGFTSPKSFKKHYSRDSFTMGPALDWINGPRKPGFTVRVEGRTRFLFQCPEDFWVMQFLDHNSVQLRVRYILE
jgi:hypothetical protein